MIYNDFQDLKLSALGLGCMRFPVVEGNNGHIDEVKTFEMIDYALDNGINYYDTAWGYHDGQSESFMGKALARHPRERFYLASKFPGYDLSNLSKVSEIFEEQLKRCQVEHFDFYLFHNVCELNIDGYLDPQYGVFDYLIEQKKNGRIKHLGFSSHGSMAVLRRFMEAYGHAMEFVQLQVNYLDWDFQSAKEKVELFSSYNIPVWVMEPLRGGKLAKLSNEDTAALAALRPDEGVPAWGFRFLQSIPSVTLTLSGMSNMEQLTQNIATYQEFKPLTETEMEALLGVGKGIISKTALPCTSCRYCTTHCPKELDIPALLNLYNEYSYTKGGALAPMALAAMPQGKRPSACIGCRSCELVCPQGIKISEVMVDFQKKLG